MPALDIGVQQQQVTVRVRGVGAGDEPWSREVPAGQFEATERGCQIGPLFVPWARIVQYEWIVRQEGVPDRTRDGARLRVKIVVDDGTAQGVTHDIPADRFETSPTTLTMLLDRHVEAGTGMLVIQKVFVPWHRVVSYERYTGRPDLDPEVVTVPEVEGAAPIRPDVD
jgi:hypothetical protein